MADAPEQTAHLGNGDASQNLHDVDSALKYDVAFVVDAAPRRLRGPSLAPAPSNHASRYPAHLDETNSSESHTSTPPKIGARFSKESIKALKRWLDTHRDHPYPSDKETGILQRQTGLNRTQVKTWLTNARRRGRYQDGLRTAKHSPVQAMEGIDIPKRPGTPATRAGLHHQSLGPLERWVDSPPEDEAAAADAIARAVASSHAGASKNTNQPYQFIYTTSSASSAGTSSGSSLASAYSGASTSSNLGNPHFIKRNRTRRRNRTARTLLINDLNPFQCTFCTDSFRTKHDWKRHEKSLHLALETWACAPHGPRAINPENGQSCCVFCGQVEPSDDHIEGHNPSACQERTFLRKDHLKQHLRLVHNTGLVEWSTKLWKVSVSEIRSRCGFCGISMDTWESRADHLADHFRMGQTMAKWEGDWGFDELVLGMIENAIQPYLIASEGNTLLPFTASKVPVESPRSAYELIALELVFFLRSYYDETEKIPENGVLHLEACRIICSSTVLSADECAELFCFSWLRDLITSAEDIMRQARFGPIRSQAESRVSSLRINGRKHLFAVCPLESQLQDFVRARLALGATFITDHELQEEAGRIIILTDKEQTDVPSDFVANWLVQLIWSSGNWLSHFRQRAGIGLHQAPGELQIETPVGISQGTLSGSKVPGDLSPQSDLIDWEIYDGSAHDYNENKGTTQMTTDDVQWMSGLEELELAYSGTPYTENALHHGFVSPELPSTSQTLQQLSTAPIPHSSEMSSFPQLPMDVAELDHRPAWVQEILSFHNDNNFDRWVTRELRRWVKATMSPNNPNSHTPSDDELQHQARCILFDE
ncbi:hypothetical protein B0J13DRAFT_77810 [Dactylonectria estremocensis]|uniref:Homeobox domain-containing protein n=1 Tax=Dactylonectria estremocensis TaxID=1079267 RepID=A0A9P9EH54_9HYPO|nr:hypothetical protein B0J13DRAFT_77810 [Dactylonectria estremocensis]